MAITMELKREYVSSAYPGRDWAHKVEIMSTKQVSAIFESLRKRGKTEVIKTVEMFIDGVLNGNPGVGSYGTILRFGKIEKELVGSEKETTSNRIILLGTIAGLSALKQKCKVEIYSNSQYLMDVINKGGLEWKAKGWKTAMGQPAKNIDLLEKIIELKAKHEVTVKRVTGNESESIANRCKAIAKKNRGILK